MNERQLIVTAPGNHECTSCGEKTCCSGRWIRQGTRVVVLLGGDKARRLEHEQDREADQTERETASAPGCTTDPFVLSCFDSYKTSLKPWHREQLDRITISIVGAGIGRKPISHILLIGHAASWRASDPKLNLGWGRAKSVATALRTRLTAHSADIARLPIITLSLGDVVPAAPNNTQAGRRLNRRVTVKLLRVPAPKKIKCEPLDDASLADSVLAILGRNPKKFKVATELAKHLKRADNVLCKRLGKKDPRLRILCMFLSSFVEVVLNEFADEPEAQLAFVRGSAYALMDTATNRPARNLDKEARRDPLLISNATVGASLELKPDRMERFVQAFEQGYGHMQGRLLEHRQSPLAREQMNKILAAIECSRNRGRALRLIYLTILDVVRSEATSIRSNTFISATGDCHLSYPVIRATRCRPLSH